MNVWWIQKCELHGYLALMPSFHHAWFGMQINKLACCYCPRCHNEVWLNLKLKKMLVLWLSICLIGSAHTRIHVSIVPIWEASHKPGLINQSSNLLQFQAFSRVHIMCIKELTVQIHFLKRARSVWLPAVQWHIKSDRWLFFCFRFILKRVQVSQNVLRSCN